MVNHRILLRGLRPLSASAGPVLLRRTDQELIPVLLDQLQTDRDLAGLTTSVVPQQGDAAPRFYQPVQRTFYVALFEAVCELPGFPRVDPQAIESAGMVIRRSGPQGSTQGWLSQRGQLTGWIELDASARDRDPDPQRRRSLTVGHALIDRQLSLLRQVTAPAAMPLAEAVAPLYIAPPEVSAKLGRTVLYGLIPVTSSEYAEAAPTLAAALTIPGPDQTSADYARLVANHMPFLLRTGGSETKGAFIQSLSNLTLNEALARRAALAGTRATGADAALRDFMTVLRQVAVEMDAFGSSIDAQALLAELNSIKLTFPGGSQQGVGDFFRLATRVLVEKDSGSFVMPVAWPMIAEAQAQRIAQLVVGSLSRKLVADEQGEQRFAKAGAEYQVRGFVRVDRDPDCPPELIWSAESPRYQIAPWYEYADTGRPLPKIDLPDPFDGAALRKLKPNVSFRVPERLFNLINSMDPADVMDNKGASSSPGFGLDWICSFSIPIITICAFIVLNIFLSLFDLFFSWLIFIKICIPVPKRVSG